MAPRKTKADGEEKAKPVTASLRVTRSMVRRTRSSTQDDAANSSGSATKLAKVNSPAKKAQRKTETKAGKRKEEEAKEEEEAAEDDVASKKNAIVIEHCKQCNAFKTRAIQVKEGLEEGVPGITVVLNPEKPRRGCFEIREEGGEAFISLLGMKRPFAPMKALDMKEVIADIIEKIK